MCQQTAQQLRNLAGQATEGSIRDKLSEAAHHLDMCVAECNYVVQRLQQGAYAGVR